MRDESEERKYLMVNVGVILAGLLTNQTIQLVANSIMAHVLTTRRMFGEVSLLLQITSVFGFLLNGGLNSALTYNLSRHGLKTKNLVYNVSLTGSVMGSLVVAAVMIVSAPFVARWYHVSTLGIALTASALALVFNALANVAVSMYSGSKKFLRQAVIMVFITAVSNIGIVAGVYVGVSLHHVLLLTGLLTSAAAVASTLTVLLSVQKNFGVTTKFLLRASIMKKMLRYGIPMWIGNIMKSIQQPFILLLTGFISIVASGYFNIGLKIVGFINAITWAFNVVALPYLSSSSHDTEESRKRATLAFRYNNFILFPVVLFTCLFANVITNALFGQKYTNTQTQEYVILLAIGVLLSSVGRLGGTLLAGIGKTRANFWVMDISGVIVLIGAPIFMRHNAMNGPWVYLIGWGISVSCIILFMKWDGLDIDWWKAFAEPALPSILTLLLYFAVSSIFHSGSVGVLTFTVATLAFSWLAERRFSFRHS